MLSQHARVRVRWTVMVVGVVVAAMTLATGLAAQERAAARAGATSAKGWWEREGVSEALNLSAKQASQIQVLENAKKELIKEVRSAEFRAYRELINAMEDGATPAEELAQLRQTGGRLAASRPGDAGPPHGAAQGADRRAVAPTPRGGARIAPTGNAGRPTGQDRLQLESVAASPAGDSKSASASRP